MCLDLNYTKFNEQPSGKKGYGSVAYSEGNWDLISCLMCIGLNYRPEFNEQPLERNGYGSMAYSEGNWDFITCLMCLGLNYRPEFNEQPLGRNGYGSMAYSEGNWDFISCLMCLGLNYRPEFNEQPREKKATDPWPQKVTEMDSRLGTSNMIWWNLSYLPSRPWIRSRFFPRVAHWILAGNSSLGTPNMIWLTSE